MRILTIADEPNEYLWGDNVSEALDGADMIISCGGLPAEYLDYLATFTAAPVFYVHGNHGPILKIPRQAVSALTASR